MQGEIEAAASARRDPFEQGFERVGIVAARRMRREEGAHRLDAFVVARTRRRLSEADQSAMLQAENRGPRDRRRAPRDREGVDEREIERLNRQMHG